MASLGATYDASQGEQMSDRSVLPAGEYLGTVPAQLALPLPLHCSRQGSLSST
jgi:hypothetical protein